MNSFTKKYQQELLDTDILENAEQVKSWNKHNRISLVAPVSILLAIFLGVVVGMISLTPSIIEICN